MWKNRKTPNSEKAKRNMSKKVITLDASQLDGKATIRTDEPCKVIIINNNDAKITIKNV